jgi:hypothetical protein
MSISRSRSINGGLTFSFGELSWLNFRRIDTLLSNFSAPLREGNRARGGTLATKLSVSSSIFFCSYKPGSGLGSRADYLWIAVAKLPLVHLSCEGVRARERFFLAFLDHWLEATKSESDWGIRQSRSSLKSHPIRDDIFESPISSSCHLFHQLSSPARSMSGTTSPRRLVLGHRPL